MKKYLVPSTLIAASFALSVPAWATDYSPSGSGTQNDPYYATSVPTSSDRISISTSIFTEQGTTIYLAGDTEDKALGNSSINSFLNGSVTAYCDIVIGAAGIYLTNGSSSNIQTFYGAISGEGSWTSSNESSASVVIHYAFLGDLSKWNGNFTIYTTNTNDYVAFGGTITNGTNNVVASVTGQAAATNTSVSGNGSIAVDYGTVHYAYTNYATGTSPSALTVTNTYIEAHKIEFGGAVNYDVSSDLMGVDAGGATNSTLEISTSGNVTVTGSISGFDSVVVDTGSKLTLSGDVSLSSAISNSGTVVVTTNVVFELGNLTDSSGTYTIIDGGTITDWSTLTSANFTLDGWDLGRSTVDVNTAGQVTVTTAAESLTWAGEDGATWSNQGGNWVNGSSSTETFYNGDNVTFGSYTSGEESKTVNISGSLLAGTITVSDNYTFVFEDGAYVEASYVDVTNASYTLKLQVASGGSAEFHMDSENFYQFFTGDENKGNIDIGTGVTFYLSDLANSASFTSASFSITGTGTLSVGATGGIGLYLPDFQGTVEFRSGTVRFASDTGIYNSKATLLFDDGAGIQLTGDFSTAVSAKLVFTGTHTINSNGHSGEFSGAIDATNATITKSGSGTITFSGSDVNIGELDVSQGNITFAGDATIGTFKTATSSSSQGNTIALGENAKLTVGTLTNAWGSNFTLADESVLTVTGVASFETGYNSRTVSGTGTFNAETFTFGNGANYTFEGITLDVGTMELGVSSNGNTDVTALTFTDVTATIESLSIGSSSSTPVTFTGGSADIGAITVTANSAKITFEGSGEFTIGSYTESNYSTFAIGENTTVTVGTFSVSYNETFNFGTDSVLNVTGELSLHVANTETISGGTINAETLNLYNYTTAEFSEGTLNIGSGGIISSGDWGGWENNYLIFGDGLTVGVYAGVEGNNTGWSSDATIQLTGTDTGTTFFTDTGESITITGSISGDGNLTKTGDGTLTVSNYGVTEKTTVSEGTLVLTGETALGGSAEIHVETGATLDLTGVTKTQISGDTGTKYDILYIEGGTVTVQNLANGWNGRETNFGSAMYNGMLQISNGGVLDVTVAQTDADLSGEKRGFAVTEGEGTYRYSGDSGTTSYIVADGNRTIHIGNAEDNATLIFDVVNSGATLDVSMAIAYGMSTSGDVGSGTTSSGSLVKTGAGTLILEAANNYSGGTTIKEGVLVAANSSALGTGDVTIEGGAQLSVSSGVTIENAISVTLNEAYQCVNTPLPTSAGSGQIAAYASGDEGIYAITGTGGTLSTEITIFLDDTIKQLLAEAGEEGMSFYLVDISNLDDSSDFTVSLSEALSDYNYDYDTSTGILWIAAAPEPSMFGLFFGLGAIGLVATRRRRR